MRSSGVAARARFAHVVLAALSLVSASRSMRGQAASSANVIETPNGRVEVLGLKRWTVDGLQDSLRAHAGYDLRTAGAHACGAVLRYKLHFADAASIEARDSAGAPYWIVTVTEPQDSARIHHHFLPLDTAGGRPDWASARSIVQVHPSAMMAYILSAAYANGAKAPSLRLRTAGDSAAVAELRTFTAERSGLSDEREAMAALQTDSSLNDRLVAVTILASFPQDDSAWAALSQSWLESDGIVKGTAMSALRGWVGAGKRPHDWVVVAPAVHAVFDGTSEFMMPELLHLFAQAKPDPALAKPFLRNGGTLLLAYAGAHLPSVRNAALGVLRSLSGKDFGTNVDQWRDWVRSLS
ncbi:MAG TPA: hypothetical protein VNW46_00015 [Gemmatimonadaceae bacterium]|jgi:hypothetical protein|nr:hypothetical protein [Gemmatimonadaceae bacterium]